MKVETKLTVDRLKKEKHFSSLYDKLLKNYKKQDKFYPIKMYNGHIYRVLKNLDHKQGVWQRTSVENYIKNSSEKWEELLDLDLLLKNENKKWVYKDFICWPGNKNRCLLRLSNGGKDAEVHRKFNLVTKKFIEDRKEDDESKSSLHPINRDDLIILDATKKENLTTSGYPRVAYISKNGVIKFLYETSRKNMSLGFHSYIDENGPQNYILSEHVTFYRINYFNVAHAETAPTPGILKASRLSVLTLLLAAISIEAGSTTIFSIPFSIRIL